MWKAARAYAFTNLQSHSISTTLAPACCHEQDFYDSLGLLAAAATTWCTPNVFDPQITPSAASTHGHSGAGFAPPPRVDAGRNLGRERLG